MQALCLRKPPAYAYDMLLLAALTLLMGLLGLPPVNGVLPQAPMHTHALAKLWQRKHNKTASHPHDDSAQQATSTQVAAADGTVATTANGHVPAGLQPEVRSPSVHSAQLNGRERQQKRGLQRVEMTVGPTQPKAQPAPQLAGSHSHAAQNSGPGDAAAAQSGAHLAQQTHHGTSVQPGHFMQVFESVQEQASRSLASADSSAHAAGTNGHRHNISGESCVFMQTFVDESNAHNAQGADLHVANTHEKEGVGTCLVDPGTQQTVTMHTRSNTYTGEDAYMGPLHGNTAIRSPLSKADDNSMVAVAVGDARVGNGSCTVGVCAASEPNGAAGAHTGDEPYDAVGAHMASETHGDDAAMPVGAAEQRVSNLIQSLLVAACLGLTYAIRQIPTSVVSDRGCSTHALAGPTHPTAFPLHRVYAHRICSAGASRPFVNFAHVGACKCVCVCVSCVGVGFLRIHVPRVTPWVTLCQQTHTPHKRPEETAGEVWFGADVSEPIAYARNCVRWYGAAFAASCLICTPQAGMCPCAGMLENLTTLCVTGPLTRPTQRALPRHSGLHCLPAGVASRRVGAHHLGGCGGCRVSSRYSGAHPSEAICAA